MAAEHAGNQRRGDADGADRHLLFISDDKRLFHVGIDVAGSAFDRKVAEVFGRALSAGEDYRVKLVGVEFGQAFDVAAGDSGRFRQYVARFIGFGRFGIVVDHGRLSDIRGKALITCALGGNIEQRAGCLVNFTAVKHAAAGEYNGNFLFGNRHFHPPVG